MSGPPYSPPRDVWIDVKLVDPVIFENKHPDDHVLGILGEPYLEPRDHEVLHPVAGLFVGVHERRDAPGHGGRSPSLQVQRG
jgi:hypothetical protein